MTTLLSSLVKPSSASKQLIPGTFSMRSCAWVLDTALSALPANLLAFMATYQARSSLPTSVVGIVDAQNYLEMFLTLLATQLAYAVFFLVLIYGTGSVVAEAGPHRATWGKRWMGLEAVNMDGDDLSYPQAALRFLAGSLSWLTLNLGHSLCVFRKDHRMLHDLIAGTQVVFDGMEDHKRILRGVLAIFISLGLGLLPAMLMPSPPALKQAFDIVSGSVGLHL